jgi:Zn-dependent M28 family amino/carboxypeptidase
MTRRHLPLALAGILVAALPPAPLVAQRCSPAVALDSTWLLSAVRRLSADSMQGRALGSIGNLKARDFLAARFDALGLGTLPFGRLQRVPIAASRLPDITHGWNVIGTISGTVHPDSFIVVTAHFDHVGIGRSVAGDSIYNGADDNASGAAALGVLAQHFLGHPPRHTLVFAAVDGEERGMWGVRGFVDAPAVPLAGVLVNVNMDMISRNAAGELYVAGPGRYPALAPVVAEAAACAPIRLLRGHDTEAAGRGEDWTTQSDHAWFHRKGIPFLYFGVEDHPDYHRPSDEYAGVMPGFYLDAVRTIADVITRLDAR